jgi:hypothetical protein
MDAARLFPAAAASSQAITATLRKIMTAVAAARHFVIFHKMIPLLYLLVLSYHYI